MHQNISKKCELSAQKLLQKIGVEGPYEFKPVRHGGNNRAWKVRTTSGPYFLKQYFYSDSDRRDRLGTEVSFSRFIWEKGFKNIPEPLASDAEDHMAIFGFIPGRKLKKEEINDAVIASSLDFLAIINLGRRDGSYERIPCASEACFSMAEHIETMENRIHRLKDIRLNDKCDNDAKHFIGTEILAKWKNIKSVVYEQAGKSGVDIDRKLTCEERIVSPSDFGFHNTILTDPKKLYFVDFEYAGWDDPAKLICDFFCQPEVPVPVRYFDGFAKQVFSMAKNVRVEPEKRLLMAKMLFPLYQLKWCCIMLNDFLSCDGERKKFASFHLDRRRTQLNKATRYFEGIRHGIC